MERWQLGGSCSTLPLHGADVHILGSPGRVGTWLFRPHQRIIWAPSSHGAPSCPLARRSSLWSAQLCVWTGVDTRAATFLNVEPGSHRADISSLRNAGSSRLEPPPAVRACSHTSPQPASNAVCCRSASRAFPFLAARSTLVLCCGSGAGSGLQGLWRLYPSHNHYERGIYLSKLVLSALLASFPSA